MSGLNLAELSTFFITCCQRRRPVGHDPKPSRVETDSVNASKNPCGAMRPRSSRPWKVRSNRTWRRGGGVQGALPWSVAGAYDARSETRVVIPEACKSAWSLRPGRLRQRRPAPAARRPAELRAGRLRRWRRQGLLRQRSDAAGPLRADQWAFSRRPGAPASCGFYCNSNNPGAAGEAVAVSILPPSMRLLLASATYSMPALLTARPCGKLNCPSSLPASEPEAPPP